MKTKTILLAVLSVLLPVAALADPCKCAFTAVRIALIDEATATDGDAEGASCGRPFAVSAYPVFACVGFSTNVDMTALSQTNHIDNGDCDREDWQEETSFEFEFYCDHLKRVSTNLTVHIDYGPDGSPSLGTGSSGVHSLHWTTELGYTKAGRSAGRIRLDADALSPALLSPRSLRLEGNGIREFVPASPSLPKVPRQLRCDECLVDVVRESSESYSISFYLLSDLDGHEDEVFVFDPHLRVWLPVKTAPSGFEGASVRTNQVYRIADGAVPVVRHVVANPDAGERLSRLRITTTRPGCDSEFVEFSQDGDVWSMNENGARTTRVVQSVSTGRRTKTTIVLDPDGTTNSVFAKVSVPFGSRWLPVETVLDAGDGPRVTHRSFFADSSDAGRFGKLRSMVGPDGDWMQRELDAFGREVERRTGWLSGGTNDACRRVVTSYGPLFSGTNAPSGLPVDDGVCDTTTPRVETVYVGDSPVEKTLRAIHKDTMGYIRVETVRLLDPTVADNFAAWADPANPHSLAIYMPENYGMPCSKLPWLVVNPDGTATSYDYISGDYVPGADGTPGVFTQVRGGPYFRTIATHGTAESFGIDSMGCSTNYAGIPLRTTRDVKLELRTGKREVLRMTEVCNAAGDFETVSWTTTTLDDLCHVVATRSSDGSRTENEWLGDRLVASTGADGIRTTYAYDGLGRRISSTYVDPLTGAEVMSSTTYDAAGRVLALTTTAGGLSMSTQRRYDSAGRLVWSRGPDGIETATSYGTTNGLHFVATTRGADGLFTTSATYSYADGLTAYVERNGKRAETYEYGYADGLRWTIAYEGPKGTNSPVWTASVSDAFGRTISELRPGFGGSILETSYAYNAAGQLLSSEEYTLSAETTPRTPRTPREILALRSLREINPQPGTLRSRTLNLYDSLGALRVSASDVNLNGTIDFAGPDIVSSNETAFAFLDSAWWRESSSYSFPDTGSAAPLRVSTTRTRLSGLGGSETTELGAALLASETRSIDALGNVSTQKSYRNRASHASFTFSTSASSALSAWSLSLGGHSVSNRTATGILSSRAYDALGRVVSTTDGRNNVSSYSYDERGRLASTTDATSATTAYGYDSLGRRTSVTNALGLVTTTSYDLDNNITAQGGAQYPVWYSYDDYGRMRAMTTFRTEDLASGDVTTWHYDEATGFLVFKEYADGKGPTYDYTADGKLSRRTWARGVVTDYAYDGQGRLVAKTYSDATPAVSLAYDRLGNTISAICAGVSTNLYAYNRLGQLTNEVQNGTTIARTYDALGRATGYALEGAGISTVDVGTQVEYGYDALGRFTSVTSGDEVFTYGYVPGSSFIGSVANNHGLVRTTTYEPHRNLIATVENAHSNNVISRFDYVSDAIGRRTSITRSGSAFSSLSGSVDHYGYNDRSEVVSARRTLNGEEVRGFSFGYAYDPIGNRTSSTEWDENGVPYTSHYTANELNEYESRTVPGHVTVLGEAATDATVTVNGNPAWRKGVYFAGGDSFDNTSSNVFAKLTTTAVRATDETDEIESSTGRKFLAQTPETFTYDDDGNMISDGRFIYTWDAENRMIVAETRNGLDIAIPIIRTTNSYDHRFRRIGKTTWKDGIQNSHFSYRYDELDTIAEFHTMTNFELTVYIWGLDNAFSLHTLNGVGGLLMSVDSLGKLFTTYDANGNLSEFLHSGSAMASHCEYDSFGNRFVVGACPSFGFVSKRHDSETGAIDFGYRLYSPQKGMWFSRDPLNEVFSRNLFVYSFNNSLSYCDSNGLFPPLMIAPPQLKAPVPPTPRGPIPTLPQKIGDFAEWSDVVSFSGSQTAEITFSGQFSSEYLERVLNYQERWIYNYYYYLNETRWSKTEFFVCSCDPDNPSQVKLRLTSKHPETDNPPPAVSVGLPLKTSLLSASIDFTETIGVETIMDFSVIPFGSQISIFERVTWFDVVNGEAGAIAVSGSQQFFKSQRAIMESPTATIKCTIQGGVPKISVETSPRKTFKERKKNQQEPMDNNWT